MGHNDQYTKIKYIHVYIYIYIYIYIYLDKNGMDLGHNFKSVDAVTVSVVVTHCHLQLYG